ncbi:ATP-binding protein [Nocardia sp. CDC186]|uniref:ATP-binding protein n=1 Tax=Nocardia implantans TaxID=3108168 RepID=A0ABU6ASR5_9NOCA|nr:MULTISPECIES: ATP-binding protein [unclassified Nocardia]MBF6190806.1 ATP-binding protein [Nocardia beijingensis]MEA3528795.1 ATP-binding protein [Nocardia sp. CDC192]MEB3510460.1 ATP-binding protein [Nocardia sp. CDC186]
MSELRWSERHEKFVTAEGMAVGRLDERFRNEVSVDIEDVEDVDLEALLSALGDAADWYDRVEIVRGSPHAGSHSIFTMQIGCMYDAKPWILLEFDSDVLGKLRLVMGLPSAEISWTRDSVNRLIQHIWSPFDCEIETIRRTGPVDLYNDRDHERQLPHGWEVCLLLGGDACRSVGDIMQLGMLSQSMLQLAPQIPTNAVRIDGRMAWSLLRTGQAEWLLGQEESSTLEVKSAAYDLSQWSGKIELAQDVARFANAENGGTLIIGVRTKKKIGSETVVKIVPVSCEHESIAQYQKVIDSRVYPLVDGLVVDRFPHRDGGYIMAIMIPPQKEDSKPYLVQGAFVDGKYEGAFISIVRRRGEGSVPVTASAIHAYLVAGRKALHQPEKGVGG